MAREITLTLQESHDVMGEAVLNVYCQYENGPSVIAGSLRLKKIARNYLRTLARGRKPKNLKFAWQEQVYKK